MTKQAKSTKTLYLMFVLFFLPFIAATLAYTYRDSLWFSTKNYGDLIKPVQMIQEFTITDLQGNPVSTEGMLGKWWLIVIAPKNCTTCAQQVEKISSVYFALNRDSTRVSRVVLNMQADDVFISQDPEVLTYVVNPDNANAFVKELAQNTRPQILLMDPLGNVMMRYPESAQGNGILRDMLQLLKVSRIG